MHMNQGSGKQAQWQTEIKTYNQTPSRHRSKMQLHHQEENKPNIKSFNLHSSQENPEIKLGQMALLLKMQLKGSVNISWQF